MIHLQTQTRRGKNYTGLVQKRTAKGVRPVQRNLLVPRWDVNPRAIGKRAGGTGQDVLLEDIARADPVFACYLQVHSPCELPIVEQGGNVSAYLRKVDGS